jgi:cyclic pyranopterin monophosphate synthase
MMTELTHFDSAGRSRMVDVGGKQPSLRTAIASGIVKMKSTTQTLIRSNQVQKGDVLGIARVAAIMATKRTSELIPLCHPLGLDSVTVQFSFPDESSIGIEVTVSATERTGVEMEALMAVSVAGLTIYDMCKSVDKEMNIAEIRLEKKTGGKNGTFCRSTETPNRGTNC